jgi:uncharacterized protein
MMRYNVAQLLKQHSGTTRTHVVDVELPNLDEELQLRAPVQGEVTFMRTSDGVLVTGVLHTEVEISCDRCLEPFVVPVSISLEESFLATVDILTGMPVELEEGADRAVLIDSQHTLDLTEVVRQDILVALPMHPVCSPDCRGLCPECGKNLNEGPCDCQPAPVDLRWEALRDLVG